MRDTDMKCFPEVTTVSVGNNWDDDSLGDFVQQQILIVNSPMQRILDRSEFQVGQGVCVSPQWAKTMNE